VILKVAGEGPGAFRLIEAADVQFGHGDGFSFADVRLANGLVDRVLVRGTAYVLNAGGDTIEKFSERQERKG